MAFDRADIYVSCTPEGEFWQGEILSGILEYQWHGPSDEVILVDHPLAIILSADCDLTQDYDARRAGNPPPDKLLRNVLLCDLYLSDDLFAAGKASGSLNSKLWAHVRNNKSERYHFLAEVPADRDLQGTGFGRLAMDFKNYFCVSILHLQKQVENGARRRCRLAHPFAQHLAQRFFYYQSRVGLPVEHDA